VKRYLILAASVLMLMLLGTNQAWSVFVRPLRHAYGYSALEMQWIFNTGSLVFCTMIIAAGRLHDLLGPRPLAAASAVLIGLAWTLAWAFGERYAFLWVSIGVLAAMGNSVGYVCPIATAIKWFPNRPGLLSGLAAAGFGGGPILLSGVAEALMGRGWAPRSVFGLLAAGYAPAILALGMMLAVPSPRHSHAQVTGFRRGDLFHDRRFWTLFAGMLAGTLPFLLVMGNAKPLAEDFGLGASLAAVAITVLALGNACGRICWGLAVDRFGTRCAMLSAQAVMIACMVVLIALGRLAPVAFFAAIFGVGLCYGSNFAIYPAAVTRLYGVHVLGSVYPLIMAAQAISSFSAAVNGFLKDTAGSNMPGLVFAASAAVVGILACAVLSRSLSEGRSEPARGCGPVPSDIAD